MNKPYPRPADTVQSEPSPRAEPGEVVRATAVHEKGQRRRDEAGRRVRSTQETPNPAGQQCGWGGGEAGAGRGISLSRASLAFRAGCYEDPPVSILHQIIVKNQSK